MATLLSDLETRLLYRLGINSASALETNRVREALNAAISKVASDGQPGATSAFSALVRDEFSATVDTHSANSATLTVTDVIAGEGIFPGDFFEDSAGAKYVIYSVDEAGKAFGLGSPVETAITGTLTITRRSIELPNDGQVFLVRHEDTGRHLDDSIASRSRWGFETGEAAYYAQHYSEGQELSFITLAPIPTAGDQYILEQSKFRSKLGTSDNYDLPEVVLNAILSEALQVHLAWSGGGSPLEAAVVSTQVDDFEDGIKNSGSGGGLIRKV